MNEKTKTILNWAIAIVIAGTISLLILLPETPDPTTESIGKTVQKVGFALTDPSLILTQFSTVNAISQFGGDISTEGFSSALLFGLAGIVILFIIAPTLILFGYKKAEKATQKLRPLAWHLGTGIILAAIGFGLYSSYSWTTAKDLITESVQQQREMDKLRLELMDLSFDASVQAVLPQEKGGGSGSFTNFMADDGSSRNIRLSDLDRYNPNAEFDFVISENITDSTITITGVTDVEGNNVEFQNADGSTGFIQLSVTVHPYNDSRMDFKQENEFLFASQ